MSQTLLEKASTFVKNQFDQGDTSLLNYHNWQHTQNVWKAAKKIASNYPELNKGTLLNLELAAVFHDVGFILGREDHEQKGAFMAREFLLDQKVDKSQINEVERLILATQMNHKPTTLDEEIIRDADLSHLGRPDYLETSFKSLSKELNNCQAGSMSQLEWIEECITFLSQHKYYTEFAQNTFGVEKQRNLKKLIEMKSEMEDKEPRKKKKKKKATKDDSPLKGVETMFKVSLRNHVNLSQIADNKANTLISVNAIIISIVLSALFPKLDSNPFLFYPGISILLFSIITIILSILSTIPNVNRGVISKKEVEEKKGNLLFFGNFFKMNLKEYEWSMNELMNDKEYLYNTLTRDLYFLGKVLNKKYTLLRFAYYSFVIGLIASIVIFTISISTIIDVW